MTKTTTGWLVLIAALGMMCGLLAVDIARLTEWSQATTPTFVGLFLGHLSAVIAAFIGGKIMPENRENKMTRSSDSRLIPAQPPPKS